MFIWKLIKTLNLISGVTVHRTINTIPAFVCPSWMVSEYGTHASHIISVCFPVELGYDIGTGVTFIFSFSMNLCLW